MIAVFVREREHDRFRGSTEGASREAQGAQQWDESTGEPELAVSYYVESSRLQLLTFFFFFFGTLVA